MSKNKKSKKKNTESTKYIVDVPNFDNEGNDVSSDHPHGGGRRRKDGTLETSTYNYVPLDDYKDSIREEIRREVREEMEYKRNYGYDRDSHDNDDGNHDEYDHVLDMAEKIDSIVENITTIAQILYENPEMVEGVKKFGRKVKNGITNGVKDGAGRIKNVLKKKDIRQIAYSSLKKEKVEKSTKKKNKKPSVGQNDIVKAQDMENTKQSISIDEARAIFLRMLNNYILLRKDYDTLKKSGIIDSDQMKIADLMSKLEGLIQEYPQLLEEGIQEQIRVLLSDFMDEQEKRKLLEVFRMAE